MAEQWFELEGRAVLMNPESKEVFGQVVKSGELHWLAYNNDPAKHDGNGALLLGKFPFLLPAKAAVEKSVKT